MGFVDVSQWAFNGEEIRSIAEIIFERNFPINANQLYAIQTGIEQKKQIGFASHMGEVGQNRSGCDPTANMVGVPLSEKFWEPIGISDKLGQCYNDLRNSFFDYGLRKGIRRQDLTDTDFAEFILERFGQALTDMRERLHWHNNASAQTVGNGGVVSDTLDGNPTNIALFNAYDGIWKQIFDAVTAGDIVKVDITENGGANYADQLNLADDTAYLTLKAMYETADDRLIEDQNARFGVTKELFYNYQTWLEDKSNSCNGDMRVEDGVTRLFFRGIEVVPLWTMSRQIKKYFNNGTTWNLPNRALLTVPSNIPMGTVETSTLTEVDLWNDRNTKNFYFEFEFRADSKLLEEYMIKVAY